MNHPILALDTATEFVSVALLTDSALTGLKSEEKNRHTELILSMADTVLTQKGLKPVDLKYVAFGAGPGSFTGLRVACGVAQGLGWALDIPLLAVSNLMATVWGQREHLCGQRVIAAIDARMHECYVAAYAVGETGVPEKLTDPMLIKPEALTEFAALHGATAIVGSAVSAYPDCVPESMETAISYVTDAEDIAQLAALLIGTDAQTTAACAAPLYVRNRVALTIEERARGEKL